MKIKFITYSLCFLICVECTAQKKKWHNNYWIGGNVGMLLGVDKLAPNFALNAGRTLGTYKIGLDFQLVEFSNTATAKITSLYFDKAINGKKNQLFFYASPGLAYSIKGENNLRQISRLTYKNSKPGFNFQFGTGIKWLVKKHNVYLSGGYSITNFNLYANEYPTIINPYNPTIEETVVHKYHLKYNKIQIKLGFQL
jgi:hypothetical protein